jgi:Putative metal-binding motif
MLAGISCQSHSGGALIASIAGGEPDVATAATAQSAESTDGGSSTSTPPPSNLPTAVPSQTAADPVPAVSTTTDNPPGTPVLVGAWSTTLAPSSCVQGLPKPIPGCDPKINPTWDLDCDRDGIPDHIAFDCDPSNTELAPFHQAGYDCAPTDPNLYRWISVDSDEDGFLEYGEFNCGGDSLPAGYVEGEPEYSHDCDDASPTVFPGADEVWGDGIDSDCVNGDAPSCDVLESGASIATRAPERVECEGGSNLYLLESANCDGFYLLVSNSGEQASPDDASIQWTDDTGGTGALALESIPPGKTSLPLRLPYEQVRKIELTIAPTDCSPEDNTATLYTGYCQMCLFP